VVHGPRVAGQSLVSYANGPYEVGFQHGGISFLEVGWEEIGGITMASAQQQVAALPPSVRAPADGGRTDRIVRGAI
jgi:hypothetical protein